MDGDTTPTPPDSPQMADPGLLAIMSSQGVPQTPQPAPPTVTQPGAMPTDPNTIEATAAAVHHGRMAEALNAIGNLLGGDTTVHVTKHPDGSVDVTHDPSTGGEKWGRVAQAAVTGAAKGFAVGTGPGGMARAGNAGLEAGQEVQQAPQKQADAQAEIADKRMLNHANLVLTQQRLVAQTLANKQAGLTLTKEQQDQANDEHDRYINSPNSTFVGTFGSIDEAAKSSNAALILKNHPNGTLRTVAAYDGKGNLTGIHAYVVDKAWGDRMNDAPLSYIEQVPNTDPKAPPQFKQVNIPINADTNSKLDTFVASKNKAAEDVKAAWAKAHPNQVGTQKTLPEMQLRLQQTTDPAEKAQLTSAINAQQNSPDEVQRRRSEAATAGEAGARTDLIRQQLAVLRGGAGAGGPGGAAAQGLHGEAYLQQSGLDPTSFAQIRAAAKGDVKMPTASRSPQNQAFRNAVMNYDPTFTDARYDAKQDFKNKKQADNLQSLSTGLEHVERAAINSAKLGNSPSLLTGKNLSGAASAYNQDVNLFTEEAGKLVKNSVLSQHEFDTLRQGMQSPAQSIRDAAIKETVNLLGGRVNSTMQRYRTAAGQDLPVEDYFDQPTQARLKRYGIAQPAAAAAPAAAAPASAGPGAAAAPATAGPTFKPMTPPANEPVQPGRHYGMGPKGLGWYK